MSPGYLHISRGTKVTVKQFSKEESVHPETLKIAVKIEQEGVLQGKLLCSCTDMVCC